MELLTGYQHPWGTCDWGECDEPATEWRWSEAHLMHLPVCDKHSPQGEADVLRATLANAELKASNLLRPMYGRALRSRHSEMSHIEPFEHCFLCAQEKVEFDQALASAFWQEGEK